MLTNFHSHTNFCDGTDAPELYVVKALELGLTAYGFSSHAPIPYKAVKWCMDMNQRWNYVNEIVRLKVKYASQIEIYCGMEVDFIPNMAGSQSAWIKELKLDYTIGSIHLVGFEDELTPWEVDGTHEVFKRGLYTIFNNDIKSAVKRYFKLTRQMLLEDKPTILGHLDKIKMHNLQGAYFNESETWYVDEVIETLEVAKQTNVIVELNTRGIYKKKTDDTYPSNWIVKEMKRLEIPVMVNSDGHHPSEIVKGYEIAFNSLKLVGIEEVHTLQNGKWVTRKIPAIT